MSKAVEIVLKAKDLASSVMTKLNARIKSIGKTSTSSATGTNKLTSSIGSLTAKVGAFIGVASGFVLVKKLFEGVLSTGGNFEKLQVQLDALSGSAEAGEQAFSWIKQFTKEVPFELDGVTDAFIKMKAFGLDPMDGSMKALTDQAALLGGGQDKLRGIVVAVGQAWAKQKLQGEEVLQLVERGVPVWELLNKTTGKTTAELFKMMEAGKLGRDVIKDLITEIGKSADGAAIAQMTKWNGLVSNGKDQWKQFLDLIANSGVLDYFKAQLTSIIEKTKEMTADGSLKELAKNISDAMISMAESVKSTISVVVEFSSQLKTLALTFVAIKFASYAAGFVTISGGIWKAVAAQKALNLAMKANPIGIVITLIGLLSAGIGALIAKYTGSSEAASDAADANDKNAESVKKSGEVHAEAAAEIDAYSLKVAKANEANAAFKEGISEVDARLADLKAGYKEAGALALDTAATGQVYVDKMNEMSRSTKGLAEELSSLNDLDFADFTAGIKLDIEEGYLTAAAAVRVENAILEESFNRLGLSTRQFTTGLSEAGEQALRSFDVIAQSAKTTSGQISAAFDSALSKIDTTKGLDSAKEKIEALAAQGKISSEDLGVAIQSVDDKFKQLNDGLSEVGKTAVDQFKRISSQAEITGKEISIALNDALNNIDTKTGLNEVKAQLEQLHRDGTISLGQLVVEIRKVEDATKGMGNAIDIARESLSGIVDGFNAAATVAELDNVGLAAKKAWTDGKISAENYIVILAKVDQKKRDIISTIRDQIDAELDLAYAAEDSAAAQEEAADRASRSVITYNAASASRVSGIKMSTRALENLLKIEEELDIKRAEIFNRQVTTQEQSMRLIADYNNVYQQSVRETENAIRAAKDLAGRFEDLDDSVGTTTASLSEYKDELEAAIENDARLDDQTFDKLKRSLDGVNSRIRDINNETKSAQQAMVDMERELAQLQGDDAKVQQLDFERRRLALMAKINEAEADGNQNAVTSYQASLALLRQINDLKTSSLAADKKERQAREAEREPVKGRADSRASTSSSTDVTIALTGPDGRVNRLRVDDDDAVNNLISTLRMAGMVTR